MERPLDDDDRDDEGDDDDEIRHDPVEDDPAIAPLIALAEREAMAQLEASGFKIQIGYCMLFWMTKQQILLERYGIAWKSPAQMNPDIKFD
jgi:hypothetical protein